MPHLKNVVTSVTSSLTFTVADAVRPLLLFALRRNPHLLSCSLANVDWSFNFLLRAGSLRRRRRKAGKGCSCSGSAANAGISHALVLCLSGTLDKLDGSPSAARAVTLTVPRLAPLALTVEPVR